MAWEGEPTVAQPRREVALPTTPVRHNHRRHRWPTCPDIPLRAPPPAACVLAQPVPARTADRSAGSARRLGALPNLWSLRPDRKAGLGRRFRGTSPLHPGGQFAAVLHCGYGPHRGSSSWTCRARLVSRAALEGVLRCWPFRLTARGFLQWGGTRSFIFAFSAAISRSPAVRAARREEARNPSGLALTHKPAVMGSKRSATCFRSGPGRGRQSDRHPAPP